VDREAVQKKDLISELIAYLREEFDQAPDESRKQELKQAITMLRFLPSRHYEASEPIVPSSLVQVRLGEVVSWVFLVPSGGGWVLRFVGRPVQVLSPESPLGAALMGKKSGDLAEVSITSGKRTYLIDQAF
jgi:hypothetical protein